jgi:hypothetical protein
MEKNFVNINRMKRVKNIKLPKSWNIAVSIVRVLQKLQK